MFSAIKRLITINTHKCIYTFKKKELSLYIKYIYMNINIFKLYGACESLYT